MSYVLQTRTRATKCSSVDVAFGLYITRSSETKQLVMVFSKTILKKIGVDEKTGIILHLGQDKDYGKGKLRKPNRNKDEPTAVIPLLPYTKKKTHIMFNTSVVDAFYSKDTKKSAVNFLVRGKEIIFNVPKAVMA